MTNKAPAIDEMNDATREKNISTPPIKKLNIKFIPSDVSPDDISKKLIYENRKQHQPILVKIKDGDFVFVCILPERFDFCAVISLKWFFFSLEKKTNGSAKGPSMKPRKLQYIVSDFL